MKGQVNAAVLVAIIAGLIILYIIFLPGEERREILGEEEADTSTTTAEEDILLSEHVGRLEKPRGGIVEHSIDPVNLYTKKEDKVLKSLSSVYVRNGWFDKKTSTLTFKLDAPSNTANALLSFNVKKHKGRIIIRLNDNEIYNNEIKTINVEPIILPNEYLREDNTIEISVSGVGIRFWRTNEYILENVKVTASVTDISARRSENIFIVAESEKQNLDEVKLKFSAECTPTEAGILNVLINNQNIFSSVPDCGSLTVREFSPFYLSAGENRLTFRIERGRYLIDQIKIRTELKETPSYVEYFELDEDQYDDVLDDRKDVNLTIEFVDDEELKEADIILNGRKIRLRTYERLWSKNIDSYVREGTNALKITPETTLDIVELKVELID